MHGAVFSCLLHSKQYITYNKVNVSLWIHNAIITSLLRHVPAGFWQLNARSRLSVFWLKPCNKAHIRFVRSDKGHMHAWKQHKYLMVITMPIIMALMTMTTTQKNGLIRAPNYMVFAFPTRIFCRGVSGFVTSCPCGVWGGGSTTFPLFVGLFFVNLLQLSLSVWGMENILASLCWYILIVTIVIGCHLSIFNLFLFSPLK